MPLHRFRAALFHLGSAALLLCGLAQTVPASPLTISGSLTSSTVGGVPLGAGDYTLAQLMSAGSAVGSVTVNGETGISLWSLLGGDSTGASDVVTSTPAGSNSKNAILRYYALATSITGAQSIVSMGEVDPFFGGTAAIPPFIAYAGTDGQPALVFAGSSASARNIVDLANLQILSTPALPNGAGGQSTGFLLGGGVAHAGTYTLTDLQALPASSVTIGGDTYTGVPLFNLLSPTSNPLISYVLASGTDGYEVLYSLAELNPAYGAPLDLVPYSDTGGSFPASGFARTVIPGDNHQGRYVSNLNSLEVVALPEPGTLSLTLAFTLFAAGLLRRSETRG